MNGEAWHFEGRKYKNECTKCKGKGVIKEKGKKKLRIPAGIDSGNQLRIPGYGMPGVNGGPSGDAYVQFIVSSHEIFIRDNYDIILELPITISEAVLGCKKEIPTLTGNVILEVKPGTSTGDKVKLKGKGVKKVNGFGKGNMYVVYNVIIPTKLTMTQKRLIKELSNTDLEDATEFREFKKYL